MADRFIINDRPATDLRTSDFYYDLPQELIAQHPMEKRDTSRLMILDRKENTVEHKHFYDIIDHINPEDVLVINESKVIPARLYGHAEGRPEAGVELLLLRQRATDTWECLVKPGKRARIGHRVVFGDGMLTGEVVDMVEEGNRLIRFDFDREKYENVYNILHEIGLMPLPPYITERLQDNARPPHPRRVCISRPSCFLPCVTRVLPSPPSCCTWVLVRSVPSRRMPSPTT